MQKRDLEVKGYFLMGDGKTKSTDPQFTGQKRKAVNIQMRVPQKRYSQQTQEKQQEAKRKASKTKNNAPAKAAPQKKKSSRGMEDEDDAIDVESN